MNAIRDEYGAPADLPCQAEALIATITDQVRQDKLHAEIGRLRARVFWAFVLGCFVGFVVGGIAGRIF